MLQYFRTLLCAQPVAGAKPKLFDPFYAADPGRQFGTEQTSICGFVGEPSNGRELLVDGIRRQTSSFQVHAVANDHNAIEGQARFGAIPGNKLVDGVLVDAARGWRAEAVEHDQFAMIEIRQPQHSATVIRLSFLFAHGDGLPCRTIGTTADRLGDASVSTIDGFRGFERYGLVSSVMVYAD
ncbi:MAG: hypothetical protein ACLQBK_00220 [Candidatus Sulfotelmatobacter sp.]